VQRFDPLIQWSGEKVPIPYDPARYRQRYKIENMFGSSSGSIHKA